MSKEDYERVIAAEAVVANEKKSTALAYVFAILFGFFGAHNFYLGRPWLGALNLVLLVLSFLPGTTGYVFLAFNLVLVVWDLFQIPSIIREHSNAIRRRFMSSGDNTLMVPQEPEKPQAKATVAEEQGMNPALWALFVLIVISVGATILGSKDRNKSVTGDIPERGVIAPAQIETEHAAPREEPPQPVEVDKPPPPATEASPPPATVTEEPKPSPAPRKGSKRKTGGRVEMSPQ